MLKEICDFFKYGAQTIITFLLFVLVMIIIMFPNQVVSAGKFILKMYLNLVEVMSC